SPDGRRIVTASADRTARVWDATTGKQLVELSGHEDSVSDAEFSADGLRIVTASRDRSVRVWESATGRALAVFNGHDEEVETAAFSPDGSRVISASYDDTARVWDARIAPLGQQLAWAEAAQFDPLAPNLRAAAEFPSTAAGAAGAPSGAIEPAGAYALAREGEAAEGASLGARTESEREADLLRAFGLFAEAEASAERAGWANDVSLRWRYRQASLARVLASRGMMSQVAQLYTRTPRQRH